MFQVFLVSLAHHYLLTEVLMKNTHCNPIGAVYYLINRYSCRMPRFLECSRYTRLSHSKLEGKELRREKPEVIQEKVTNRQNAVTIK